MSPYLDWGGSFGIVLVYDPVAGTCYNQTTRRHNPAARVSFCIAGVPSTNVTYETFVYAGNKGNLGSSTVPFEKFSIFSLPAFEWFSAYYPPQCPCSGHTCEVVGGSQTR